MSNGTAEPAELRVDLGNLGDPRDTYLYLHDDAGAAGTTVTASELGSEESRNDDFGGTRNSRIEETALAAGTYTIEATTYSNARTGSFTPSLSSGTPLDLTPDFGLESVPDQTYGVNGTVSLQLPLATGGNRPLTYSISPALPAGLTFDARARTITGTPTSAMSSTPYTYTVTDADAADAETDTLTFDITVTGAPTPPPDMPVGSRGHEAVHRRCGR